MGAGLPAMAACQPILLYLTPHDPTVGAGLPAMTAYQPILLYLTPPDPIVGAGLPAMTACQPTLLFLTPHHPTVGAGLLAKAAWQSTQLDCVHIHCCGNGHLGFRPNGGSLLKKSAKVKRSCPTTRHLAWARCARNPPVIWRPPPRAIHGAGRLNRHPCRFTPQIPVEFRPAWFNGAPEIKSRARSRATRFASWLPLTATT